MPCIIDINHDVSKNKESQWVSLCGKHLWFSNDPHKSIENAKLSGKPICKTCRKIAGIPMSSRRKPEVEAPFKIYTVGAGEIKERIAIKETDTGFRTQGGDLQYKNQRLDAGLWKNIGGDASKLVTTRELEQARSLAKHQITMLKEYVSKLPELVTSLETKLSKYED